MKKKEEKRQKMQKRGPDKRDPDGSLGVANGGSRYSSGLCYLCNDTIIALAFALLHRFGSDGERWSNLTFRTRPYRAAPARFDLKKNEIKYWSEAR